MIERQIERVAIMLSYGATVDRIRGALLLDGLTECQAWCVYRAAVLLTRWRSESS